jgi:hypothetical protein
MSGRLGCGGSTKDLGVHRRDQADRDLYETKRGFPVLPARQINGKKLNALLVTKDVQQEPAQRGRPGSFTV